MKPDKDDTDYKPFRINDGEIVPKMAAYGEGFRFHVTGLVHDETGFPSNIPDIAEGLINRLINKIEDNKDDIAIYEEYKLDDADVAIIAFGGTSRSAKCAVNMARKEGLKVGLFKPMTIWPFLDKQIIELSKKVKKIIVAEMNLGQYVLEVERVANKYADIYKCCKANGELITPDEILAKVKGVY